MLLQAALSPCLVGTAIQTPTAGVHRAGRWSHLRPAVPALEHHWQSPRLQGRAVVALEHRLPDHS
eukprot:2548116-Alexandrium_andersonii.AAC.1